MKKIILLPVLSFLLSCGSYRITELTINTQAPDDQFSYITKEGDTLTTGLRLSRHIKEGGKFGIWVKKEKIINMSKKKD